MNNKSKLGSKMLEIDLMKKIYDGMTPLKGKSAIIAFSGGLDSTVVANLAKEVCEKVKLVTIISEWISHAEVEEAKAIAQSLEIPHEVITISIGLEQEFWENRPDRCFHCKILIFTHLLDYAKDNGYEVIVEGTNASDIEEHRPGLKALEKLGAFSPLLQGNITKDEVRKIAVYYNLPVANKPPMACLASRIPYGERITQEKLNRVEQGEMMLRQLGFSEQLRLRDHDTIVRIEVKPEDFSIFLDKNLLSKVVKKLQNLGYTYITLDLEGYRPSIPNPARLEEGS